MTIHRRAAITYFAISTIVSGCFGAIASIPPDPSDAGPSPLDAAFVDSAQLGDTNAVDAGLDAGVGDGDAHSADASDAAVDAPDGAATLDASDAADALDDGTALDGSADALVPNLDAACWSPLVDGPPPEDAGVVVWSQRWWAVSGYMTNSVVCADMTFWTGSQQYDPLTFSHLSPSEFSSLTNAIAAVTTSDAGVSTKTRPEASGYHNSARTYVYRNGSPKFLMETWWVDTTNNTQTWVLANDPAAAVIRPYTVFFWRVPYPPP